METFKYNLILLQISNVILVLGLGLLTCCNKPRELDVKPSNSVTTSIVGTNSNSITLITVTASNFFIPNDWNDDTIQLKGDYRLLRYFEVWTDEDGISSVCNDMNLKYSNGLLTKIGTYNLRYNNQKQVIYYGCDSSCAYLNVVPIFEGHYNQSGILDSAFMTNGWIEIGSFVPALSIKYNYNSINNLVNNNDSTFQYLKFNSWNVPEIIAHIVDGSWYNQRYHYTEKDSIIYDSFGNISAIYYTSTSVENKYLLQYSISYSSFKLGKAAEFMLWYHLPTYVSGSSYMFLDPKYFNLDTNKCFPIFTYPSGIGTYNNTTFKTNSNGDVTEIKYNTKDGSGTNYTIKCRFKYGNI